MVNRLVQRLIPLGGSAETSRPVETNIAAATLDRQPAIRVQAVQNLHDLRKVSKRSRITRKISIADAVGAPPPVEVMGR
jgi:hypothetical protein